MTQRTWNREKIVLELRAMHESGKSLRAKYIEKNNTSLHNALYYSDSSGKQLFGSLKDARNSLAEMYEREKDIESALEVRKYNAPQVGWNRLDASQLAQRRRDLRKKLLEKIGSGEDVSIRKQMEKDRSFVSLCQRTFPNGYRGCFEAEGLEYRQYARHIKKTGEKYLDELIVHVENNVPLDRLSLEKIDKKLAARLSEHYGGYYAALRQAQHILCKKRRNDLAARANPTYWESYRDENLRAEISTRQEQRRGKIMMLECSKTYASHSLMPDLENITGKEIDEKLRKSGEWLSTQDLSMHVPCTTFNISRYFPALYCEKTVKVANGSRHWYLFHRAVIDEYRRKNAQTIPSDSLNATAQALGVTYTQLRGLVSRLNIEKMNERYRSISASDQELLDSIFRQDLQRHSELIGKIDVGQEYSFSDLELNGIPVAYFDRQIRKGKIPCTAGKIRTVSGATIRKYLEEKYAGRNLRHGLRLLSRVHPHLYTSNDLIESLQLTRSTILYRMNRLIKENPQSCFRVRKSEKRRRILANSSVIPCLENWQERGRFQFLARMNGLEKAPSHNEMRSVLKELESLVDRGNGRQDIEQIFHCRSVLDHWRNSVVELGEEESIARKDILLLTRYMQNHRYISFEFDRDYSLDELRSIVDEEFSASKIDETCARTTGFIYTQNEPIIYSLIQRMGLNSNDLLRESAFDAGRSALLKSIEKFDPAYGSKFGSYAWQGVEWALKKVRAQARKEQERLPTVSLHDEVGEDAEKIDFIADESVDNDVAVKHERDEIINQIVSTLNPREREIIVRRFGFGNREPQILEEIGQDFGLTRERIRQIEAKALKKLWKHPKSKLLKQYLVE